MNIPTIYRNALSGFIIRPRTFPQMVVSAFQGTFSLFREENRNAFLAFLDDGVIQESVLGQATAGPAMMLSLFNDLQNPLFQRTKFHPVEFLEGVGPALARFHNVSGSLENQLRTIRNNAAAAPVTGVGGDDDKSVTCTGTADKDTTHDGTIDNSEKPAATEETAEAITDKDDNDVTKEEKDTMLAAFRATHSNDMFISETEGRQAVAVLNAHWSEEAKLDPDSLAGQLSRMVTKELFHTHEISAKTACLLQDPTSTTRFKEGSCVVHNVALLSARAKMFIQNETEQEEEEQQQHQNDGSTDMSRSSSSSISSEKIVSYEEVDYDPDDEDQEEFFKNSSIAAQLEVLYDVSQKFTVGSTETEETTFVGVATIQGWLQGGPPDEDGGELRWRLALHRPAYEFPGIEQAYGQAN